MQALDEVVKGRMTTVIVLTTLFREYLQRYGFLKSYWMFVRNRSLSSASFFTLINATNGENAELSVVGMIP